MLNPDRIPVLVAQLRLIRDEIAVATEDSVYLDLDTLLAQPEATRQRRHTTNQALRHLSEAICALNLIAASDRGDATA